VGTTKFRKRAADLQKFCGFFHFRAIYQYPLLAQVTNSPLHNPNIAQLELSYIKAIMKLSSEVRWLPKAKRQLRKLDPKAQQKIVSATDTLESMPECANVRTLTDHQYGYRLRVGNFRVLFDWSGFVRIAEIQEVKKRNESTY
jgi:mRNA-degrading endonuclease RelE of RelBE toxin-antitoxin system